MWNNNLIACECLLWYSHLPLWNFLWSMTFNRRRQNITITFQTFVNLSPDHQQVSTLPFSRITTILFWQWMSLYFQLENNWLLPSLREGFLHSFLWNICITDAWFDVWCLMQLPRLVFDRIAASMKGCWIFEWERHMLDDDIPICHHHTIDTASATFLKLGSGLNMKPVRTLFHCRSRRVDIHPCWIIKMGLPTRDPN